jgi:DNA repair protein RecN (Recombination protein N)
MLQSLSIQNYALINDLSIAFDSGFSIITGETGAGKSILLGALSLLVGQRADTSVLLDKSRKCVVEGQFKIGEYNLQEFFKQNELDYDNQVIIRREILDNGRSRAFVNDTPVNLNILKDLGDRLVDIHSQHQNSYLTDSQFQLSLIDILAKNNQLLSSYRESYTNYNYLQRSLSELQEKSIKEKADLDYFQFQLNELENLHLKSGEQTELEEELNVLSHAEEIKSVLVNIAGLLSAESTGIVSQLKEATLQAGKIREIFTKIDSLQERLNSGYIELKDIASEADALAETIDLDPSRLEAVKSRLDSLYSICQKHHVSNCEALVSLRDSFYQKILSITSYDEQLNELSAKLTAIRQQLVTLASDITNKRKAIIPGFEQRIITILHQLGMPNAMFSVKLESIEEFMSSGCDKIAFLFSANKQVVLMDITKIASGGEISRFMLAVKSIVATTLAMPAVIFDEIDAGVSGDIADKMANIMKQMSESMQVISITHLPQVASKGRNHYLVYKLESKKATNTYIKLLQGEDRVAEIAKMLSGEQISDAAIKNARVLLNN